MSPNASSQPATPIVTLFGVSLSLTREDALPAALPGAQLQAVLTAEAARGAEGARLLGVERAGELSDAKASRARFRAAWKGESSLSAWIAQPSKGLAPCEVWRRAVGGCAADWKTQELTEATLLLAGKDAQETRSLLLTTVEALAFSFYRFDHTDQGKPLRTEERQLKHVTLAVAQNCSLDEALITQVKAAAEIALAWQFARALGDRPANYLPPSRLVEEVRDRLAPLGVKTTILDEKQLEAQGFGGLMAVGKGSDNPPRLGIYEYAPATATETIVIVGKGITFDTGGYSIKPKLHHNEMKYDMCGAANAAAALEAIARAQLPVKVVLLLACAENMVSARATRPGDVYRAWNGKTVDVYNTDAEGRLVLADALAFADKYKPSVMVDIATLTGGAFSIAGNMAAIVCATDDALVEDIRDAGFAAGEKYLHLEILGEAIGDMKGHASDYANMNAKWSTGAPTMYAAAFLHEFVPEGVPWVHLDIANVAWGARENGYSLGGGANSYGARTLFNFVSDRASGRRRNQ